MVDFVNVKGKASWVFHMRKDRFDKWSVKLHPDADGLETVRDLQAQGMKNTLKKDEEGYFVNFHRLPKRTYNGKDVFYESPKVYQDDGKTPFEGIVGDGSDVTVVLEVYGHGTPSGGRAKSARWDSMIVHNATPYVHEKEKPKTNYNRF